MDRYILNDDNCLIGVSVEKGYPMHICLTSQEMALATAKINENECWNSMCFLVLRRTGQQIIDKMHIQHIVINGNKRDFH
jgi:hypothetical protein